MDIEILLKKAVFILNRAAAVYQVVAVELQSVSYPNDSFDSGDSQARLVPHKFIHGGAQIVSSVSKRV